MKLLYIANIRVPTEKAHGLQIMQNCEAFADAGAAVELWAARRWDTSPMRLVRDPWAHYGVKRNFVLRRLPCLDLIPLVPERDDLPARLVFLLQLWTFTLAALIRAAFTRADVYYSRDEFALLALSLIKPRRALAYEAHTLRGGRLQRWVAGRVGHVFATTGKLAESLSPHPPAPSLSGRGGDFGEPIAASELKESGKQCESDPPLPQGEGLGVRADSPSPLGRGGRGVRADSPSPRLLANLFARRGGRGVRGISVHVAHDGIRRERFAGVLDQRAARAALGWDERAFIVGYVGRLHTMMMDKGVGTLVEALAQIGGVSIALVGGPDDMAAALREDWIARGQEAGRFLYAGQVKPDQVPLYLSAFDVCAMPFPWTEHFAYYASPIKLFEYMAARRAIVATDLPSTAEVVTDGESALLVPPSDPAALAGAIRRLRDDPTLRERLAAAAYTLVMERYTWEARARAILDVLGG